MNAIVGMEVEMLDPIAPDADGIVVPRRRRKRLESAEAVQSEPQVDGRVVRPVTERLRPPGHREPRREDMRGVGRASWVRISSCSRAT